MNDFLGRLSPDPDEEITVVDRTPRQLLDALRAKMPRGCRLLTATELADAECDGNNGVDDRERGWQRHIRIEVRS